MIKKLLLAAILLTPGVIKADTGDIPLSSNFQLNSGRPLDARVRAANAAARNAISGTLRYDGLMVYQMDTKHTFQLQGDTNTWVDVTSGTGTVTTLQATGVGFGGTANEVTQDTNTFTWDNTSKTLGVTGTIIINNSNSYGGGMDASEGLAPVGVVGAQVVYADSVTHTLHNIPNNQEDYVLVMSSAGSVTTGHLVKWNAYGKIADGGTDVGVVIPSTFPWTINYTINITTALIVSGSSLTVIGQMIHTGWSTSTISNVYYDLSQSSMAVGFVKTANGYGTSGQVLTSGGSTSSPTWTTPAAGGGGGGSAAIAFGTGTTGGYTGTVISSPTSIALFDNAFFSGRLLGGSTFFTTLTQPVIVSSFIVTQTTYTTPGFYSVAPSPGTGGQAYLWEGDVVAAGLPLGFIGFTLSGGSGPGGLSIFNNTKNEMMRFGNASAGVFVYDAGGLTVSGPITAADITAVGNLIVSGPLTAGANVTVVGANYTALSTDTYISASAVAATTTITLDAATALKGQQLSIFKTDTSSWPVSVVCAGTDKINGSTGTWRLDAQGQSISITSDGISKWLARNLMPTPIQIPIVSPTDNANSVAQAASTTVLSPEYVPVPVRVTGCQFVPNVTGGMVDCHVYDANGTIVSSTTAAILGAGSTVQTINFIAPITLSPGTYYKGLSTSSPAATFKGYTCLFNCSTVAANIPPATSISLPGTLFPVATAFPRMRLVVTGGVSL